MNTVTFLESFFNDFNRLFQDTDSKQTSFPRYNITRNNSNFFLEVGLAGYKKEEIKICRDNNRLTISGDNSTRLQERAKTRKSEGYCYLGNPGITSGRFSRSWVISRDIEVISAEFEDGMLNIELSIRLPEEEKPKLIDIK